MAAFAPRSVNEIHLYCCLEQYFIFFAAQYSILWPYHALFIFLLLMAIWVVFSVGLFILKGAALNILMWSFGELMRIFLLCIESEWNCWVMRYVYVDGTLLLSGSVLFIASGTQFTGLSLYLGDRPVHWKINSCLRGLRCWGTERLQTWRLLGESQVWKSDRPLSLFCLLFSLTLEITLCLLCLKANVPPRVINGPTGGNVCSKSYGSSAKSGIRLLEDEVVIFNTTTFENHFSSLKTSWRLWSS